MGFRCEGYNGTPPNPEDVLVVWNRYPRDEVFCKRFEDAGATVLVAENGWIGHDEDGSHCFALCRSHHNGAGTWEYGSDMAESDPQTEISRFGVSTSPWRSDGDAILVLPQRGLGEPGVAMPKEWPNEIVGRLKQLTDREIVVRHHPGAMKTRNDPDFTGYWAAVTWGSGAGIKSIVAGCPVFYDMPNWIGRWAGYSLENGEIETPFVGDRSRALHDISWAQWTGKEIASGEPFKWLLG